MESRIPASGWSKTKMPPPTASLSGGPLWTRADEGALRIALRNLLCSAIKCTEEGGAGLELDASA